MANTWFRLYAEFASDPKVQAMDEAMQRRLVMLFCAQCSDVLVTFCDDDLAFYLRISNEELAVTKAKFIEKGFIDDDWALTNWNKRQFLSDSSTERTKRYRERKRTSQERHSDAPDTYTDSESESEQKREEKNKYKGNAAAPPSADADVGVCSDSSQTKTKKTKATGPTPEDYVAYWNRHCYPLEPVTDFTDDLKRLLIARINGYPLTPRKFAEVLDTATRKDFCIGKAPGNTWMVDFEFVVKSNRNIAKILNGLGRLQPRKSKESQLDAHWRHVKDLGPVGYAMQLEQRREQARTQPEPMKSKDLAEIDAREAKVKKFFEQEAARERAKERGAAEDAEFLAERSIAAETKPQQVNGHRHANVVERKGDADASAPGDAPPDGDLCMSILRTWNDNCEPEFRRVKDTPTRRNLLRICMKRHHVTPAMIFEALQYMKRFGGGDVRWFDDLIQHNTIARTLEAAERSVMNANGGRHANA